MLHDLICPDCEVVSEHLLGQDDRWVEVKCPGCGKPLTRGAHKKYAGMRITLIGENVPGGCNYDYYDENLGCHIKSKQHREEEKRRQGVRDYSPDPEMKAHRTEQTYIRKNSKPGDAAAAGAILAEKKAAQTKRRERAIDKVFDDAPLPVLPDM